MARKSLTRDEYIKRGKKENLTLVGNTPNRASIPTHWQCDICGRNHFKSLNAIVHHSACICRADMTLKSHDYQSLANRLGIAWSGQYPINSKQKVEWFGVGGVSFYASYNEIGYSFISNRIRRLIDG